MRIVTVNVPESFIEAIERLIGENGLYPSRSELIRSAVRDYLIKQIKINNNEQKEEKEQETKNNDEDHIQLPVINNGSELKYKNYKIIKRLDYALPITSHEKGEKDKKPLPSSKIPPYLDGFDDSEPQFLSYEEMERQRPRLNQLRQQNPYEPTYGFINEEPPWRR